MTDWGLATAADGFGGADRLKLCPLSPRFAATLNFANWDDEETLLRLHAPASIGHASTVHPVLADTDRYGLVGGAIAAWQEKKRMRAMLPPGARHAWALFRPDRAGLECAAELAAALPTPGIAEYDLGEAAAAHRHVESRRPGRALLLPGFF